MSLLDRTLADYKNSGMTTGPHIMSHLRADLNAAGVLRACDLIKVRDGKWTKIAGLVIVRQRPGTAKGFCFLTLEDETGTANVVIVPDMFQRYRNVIHTAAMVIVEGPLQKVLTVRKGVKNENEAAKRLRGYAVRTSEITPTANRLAERDSNPVIHVRAKRIHQLHVPQQVINLTGHGYRMRLTPEDNPNRQPPNSEPPTSETPIPFPKSHDFR